MKFKHEIKIHAPIEKVTELFRDTNHYKEWQDDFAEYRPLDGVKDEKGSTAKISFDTKRGPMELVETVIENELPDYFLAEYYHVHMTNTMKSSFRSIDSSRTYYTVKVHYTEFRGFLPKIMSRFFPGIFKKQVKKWMEQFKDFVETHGKSY